MDPRERRRLLRRSELIGEITRLTPELRNPGNPDNPYSLDPAFSWSRRRGVWHEELRMMRVATVLDDGTLAKAYSEEELKRLRELVLWARPLMDHFGLRVPVFYEGRGRRWTGGCSCLVEADGRTLPQVITLSSTFQSEPGGPLLRFPTMEMRWTLLHELAHLGVSARRLPSRIDPSTGKKESNERHQLRVHTEDFRRRHGELLHHYLTECSPTYFERRSFACQAETNDYSAPIHPEGRSWF